MEKTQKEIDEQIKKLEEAKEGIVPYSMFGTDNLALVDVMIKVLEEDIDEDEIWDEWPRDEEDMDSRSNADMARAWIDGECELDNLVEGFPMIKDSK